MDFGTITNYFAEYGLLFLFVIILLEYMNLPGLPAGIIMPAVGVLVSRSEMNLITALLVSVIAGLIGSWILYCIGRFGGEVILQKYLNKFPSHESFVNSKIDYLREKGYTGILISKLIPMARTVISIPAGVLKLNFLKYSAYATLGIFIWNTVLISSGYFLGEELLKFLEKEGEERRNFYVTSVENTGGKNFKAVLDFSTKRSDGKNISITFENGIYTFPYFCSFLIKRYLAKRG